MLWIGYDADWVVLSRCVARRYAFMTAAFLVISMKPKQLKGADAHTLYTMQLLPCPCPLEYGWSATPPSHIWTVEAAGLVVRYVESCVCLGDVDEPGYPGGTRVCWRGLRRG